MKNLTMKSLVLLLIMTAAAPALLAQKSAVKNNSGSREGLAIGLKLGDPTGISLKKYLPKNRALEFNIGSTADWGYDYRDEFYEYDEYRDHEYVGYKRGSAVAIQARYLFQNNFPDVKNLQWYWGVGAQLRLKKYYYDYRYREYYGPGGGDYLWVHRRDKVTNIDFGADGIIGLEYQIPKSPFSISADVNVMLEIFDDPFNFYGQGGIGIRYKLK